MKHILVFVILGTVCGCIMGVVIHRFASQPLVPSARHQSSLPTLQPPTLPPTDQPSPERLATVPPALRKAPQAAPAQSRQRPSNSPPLPSQRYFIPSAAPTDANSPAIPESVARDALNYVGADPDAEQVWISAINDPSLSPHDRQNLIEDLNENGLSDPDHPTMDDLPLIESRITLIEQLAPSAMDDVNYAAFQEAYKDLWNMHDQLVAR